MSDHHSDSWDGEGSDPDDGDEEGASHRDPLDTNEHEWRDDQYGQFTDPRRLALQGLLTINGDEDLKALEDLKNVTLALARQQLGYATDAGSSLSADSHIKNGVALASCFAKLKDKRDEHLKNIGGRR